MPYIIAFVIMIVAAGALFLFREPVEAPVNTRSNEAMTEEAAAPVDTPTNVPEGFTPPDGPPPTSSDDQEISPTEIEATTNAEVSTDFDPADDQRTFSAEASYFTPNRTEHEMLVTLTLKDRVVVEANVLYDGSAPNTPAHNGFDQAYKNEVIGKRLNEINLSRVGGASLTSNAFNDAVAEIQTARS